MESPYDVINDCVLWHLDVFIFPHCLHVFLSGVASFKGLNYKNSFAVLTEVHIPSS